MKALDFLHLVDGEILLMKELADLQRMDGLEIKASLTDDCISKLKAVSDFYVSDLISWKERDDLKLGMDTGASHVEWTEYDGESE